MAEKTPRHEMTTRKVVYEIPGMTDASVRQDIPYGSTDEGPLTFDLYSPPSGARHPVIVFVSGFPDHLGSPMLGCKLKEMASYISWGQLVAASGMSAVTFTSREPAGDLQTLLGYLRQHAEELDIDATRIGIWAASGNVPNALGALTREAFACAVLCYGFMFDQAGSTWVAQAAAAYRFANPAAGKSVADLPSDLPLFVVRAGRDMPQLNGTIDGFIAAALARNLPLTFANHATGPHSFDIVEDSATSRDLVRAILGFLANHLLRPR